MRGRLSTAVVSVAIVASVAACGGGGGSGGADAATGECTPDRVGGSVSMGTFSAPKGLDPVGQPGSATTGGTEITALFDTLIKYDSTTQTYQPEVAESLTADDATNQVWTLKLRSGVKFGNGDPLTAEDVVSSIARHQDPSNTQVSRGDAATIAKSDVLDPLTVRFTLDSPYPLFPRVLATDVGMITNPRLVAERGADGFANNPAGGGVGPYELERYAPGDEIVMKAKTDYWGGPVCIQSLRFVTIPGAQGTYEALQNKELDIAFLREPQVIDEARQAGLADLSTLFNFGEAVAMNSKADRPTGDKSVRQAVVAAIDTESVNQRAFNGTALATSALVHPETPGLYDGVAGPAYDPEKAKQLVAQAKAAGWDGRIRLLSDNASTRVDEAIAVKAQLEAVGFTVDVDSTQSLQDVIKKVVADRGYDLVLWGPQFSAEGLWAVMNRSFNSASKSNYYNYFDPRMDAELAKLRMASTPEQQKPIVAEMQTILDDNPFAANLAAFQEANVYDARIGGLVLDRGSIIRFDKAFVTSGD
ncbi:ABC transporter substrate-binding protein [Pseudonocardia lutea]|uniref:ABC transporter substrate-binding protein n=1 Tax=Pseudonocardia lutea TaxID=2172015 RepID=A0ABW1IDI6_9PSEU